MVFWKKISVLPVSGQDAKGNHAQLCSNYTSPLQQVVSAVDIGIKSPREGLKARFEGFHLVQSSQNRIEHRTTNQENVKLEGECQNGFDFDQSPRLFLAS